MKSRLLKNKRFWEILIILVIDGFFFGLTNPNKINSVFLIAGFILLGLTLYLLVQIIMSYLIKLGFKFKNRREIAIFSSVLVVILLALQSIGQLSGRDVLIIIPAIILLFIYLTYIRPKIYD